MTVKTTLAYGKSFHFYHEARDNNHVYLELEDVAYDAGYRRVMVAIPIDVWEVIRCLGGAGLELLDASDEELIHIAEAKVNARIAEYEKLRAADREKAEWVRFGEATMFGSADGPREEQLARGIAYYRTERARQREVAARIAQHQVVEINPKFQDPDE